MSCDLLETFKYFIFKEILNPHKEGFIKSFVITGWFLLLLLFSKYVSMWSVSSQSLYVICSILGKSWSIWLGQVWVKICSFCSFLGYLPPEVLTFYNVVLFTIFKTKIVQNSCEE